MNDIGNDQSPANSKRLGIWGLILVSSIPLGALLFALITTSKPIPIGADFIPRDGKYEEIVVEINRADFENIQIGISCNIRNTGGGGEQQFDYDAKYDESSRAMAVRCGGKQNDDTPVKIEFYRLNLKGDWSQYYKIEYVCDVKTAGGTVNRQYRENIQKCGVGSDGDTFEGFPNDSNKMVRLAPINFLGRFLAFFQFIKEGAVLPEPIRTRVVRTRVGS